MNETRAQFTHSNLQAPPTDPDRARRSASPASRRSARSPGRPTGAAEQAVRGRRTTSRTRRARTRCAPASTSSTTTTPSPIPRSIRGSYTFSSLANFLAGTYNNSGFTQTFGNPVVSQTNPNVGFYAQDEWKVELAADAESRASATTCSSCETIATDTNNVSPRAGLRLVAVRVAPHRRARQLRALLRPRAAARAGQRAALGGNTTDLASLQPDQRQPLAGAGRRAGVPEHPADAALPSGVLVNFTTMDPRHAERLFRAGQLRDRAAARRRAARSASATSICAGCT